MLIFQVCGADRIMTKFGNSAFKLGCVKNKVSFSLIPKLHTITYLSLNTGIHNYIEMIASEMQLHKS